MGVSMARSQTTSSHRRTFVIVAIAVCAVIILLTFHHNSTSYRSVVYEHDVNGSFHIFGHFRFTDFPWQFSFKESQENELSDVHLKGTRKLPTALIIGAKKTGTRALLEFIRVHPNVRAAGHEVHYFDKNYFQGVDWYRDMMPTTIDNQITLEKTPSYLVTQEAPERVSNLDPNMRIIMIVKDPVQRAISDYTQSITKRRRRRSFEDFVFLDHNMAKVNESRLLISTGIYAKHLENWLRFFPIKQICFINGHTLIKDPAQELRKLQDFLSLERVITEEHFYFNSTKGFPCLKKRESSGTPHCLGEGKGRMHPDIPVTVKAALYDYFRPYNMKFYEMTGIDFDWERNGPLEQLID